MEKNKRVYNAVSVIIDKTNSLPVIVRSTWNGFADDGAYMGMFEQHTFQDYQLNKSPSRDLSTAMIPAGFKLPVRNEPVPMLAAGSLAPDLKLTSLTGKDFSLGSLRGKTVLLNFTTDGCPHCVNAAQMLIRLYEQYNNKDFEIISIYQSDYNNVKTVARFDAKHKIKYPSYMAESTAAGTYHINGYPNFYLLDKKGIIIRAYEGFYTELEKQIIDKIGAIR
ncbi:peroxiredoxin [Pedobacter sp. SYP-B3415]|uniref:peroxiredoxin family protein n=1 Tax=Pedobacter sp. SYP-B3415 TaxID=2496641 RepID=UPI00101C7B5A|nr:TlpA disulfide reductase family protein [Pedobacter sp. SYP-B3415]